MRRAGCILIATLLLAPAWTAAQETSAALSETATETTTGASGMGDELSVGEHSGEFLSTKTKRLNRWPGSSSLPVITAGLEQQVVDAPESVSLVSNSDQQFSGFFVSLRDELREMIHLPDPDNTPPSARRGEGGAGLLMCR